MTEAQVVWGVITASGGALAAWVVPRLLNAPDTARKDLAESRAAQGKQIHDVREILGTHAVRLTRLETAVGVDGGTGISQRLDTIQHEVQALRAEIGAAMRELAEQRGARRGAH